MANYEIAEAAMLASDRYNDMLILTDADSISLLEQFGLMLDAGYPQIGRAEALSMLVHVPGSGRPLDLSRSLDGRLHYTKRQITAQFSCFRPKAQWGKLQQILELLLHGQWIWFRFKNSNWYWRGNLTVSVQPQDSSLTVTITGVCNPYSYNMTAYLGNDWLWDIFNFEEDTIYPDKTEVKRL